jgi:VanZ family protein
VIIAVKRGMSGNALSHIKPSRLYKIFMDDFVKIERYCLSLSEKATQKAEAKKKQIHRIEEIIRHGKKFICEIFSSPHSPAAYTTYRIVNSSINFYVIAWKPHLHLMLHYNEHFFLRYKSRMGVTFKKHEELLNYFLRHNVMQSIRFSGSVHGRFKQFSMVLTQGVVFGLFDEYHNIYYCRTFVANHLLYFKNKAANELPFSPKEAFEQLKEKYKVRML